MFLAFDVYTKYRFHEKKKRKEEEDKPMKFFPIFSYEFVQKTKARTNAFRDGTGRS